MRKVAVWGFVVIAVALMFTGAQAQRITLAPTVAPSKSPQQVEVTNFPAGQTVDGTVNVGNLPLDGEGNVRVAGQSYRWIQVADQVPVTNQISATIGPLDVAGWRRATFLFTGIETGPLGATFVVTVRYGGDGFFVTEGSVGSSSRQLFATEVHGPEAQVVITASGDMNVTVWLYLSN